MRASRNRWCIFLAMAADEPKAAGPARLRASPVGRVDTASTNGAETKAIRQ